MKFSMSNKLKVLCFKILLPLVFWLGVWQVLSIIVNRAYFLPSVPETAEALGKILLSKDFIRISGLTLLRVIFGLLFGTVFASVFALSAHKIPFIHHILSPAVTVIKATPIASVIILLWISMNGNTLSAFVAFLMVFPVIFQNLYDGFSSVDKELSELCTSYGFSYIKRLKILILPTLKKYFIPAFITSVGLAFKSEIAAEIIAGVRNSIGQMIYHSKDAYDTAAVFAWTIVGISFSIILESLCKLLLGRVKNGN